MPGPTPFVQATYSVTADYVSYDSDNDHITSPSQYAVGFEAAHDFMDYLSLGDGSQDLLDRSKLRISGTVEFLGSSVPFSLSEQDLAKDGVHAIDGPVRVTRVSTDTIYIGPGVSIQRKVTLFAYRSLVVLPEMVTVPGDPIQTIYQRSSMDWNEQAAGMIFYDANNPAGVTIDGFPDVITTTPVSSWGQVTGVSGTVVGVNNIPAELGETQSTYYKNDLTVDGDDTGDQRSYGDAGFQVYNPNPGTYTLLGYTYFLTGVTVNVRATYANYYDSPIQANVGAIPHAAPSAKWYIYLPLVTRDWA
jgi:hypothetical protein